jgi:hypothetical protein
MDSLCVVTTEANAVGTEWGADGSRHEGESLQPMLSRPLNAFLLSVSDAGFESGRAPPLLLGARAQTQCRYSSCRVAICLHTSDSGHRSHRHQIGFRSAGDLSSGSDGPWIQAFSTAVVAHYAILRRGLGLYSWRRLSHYARGTVVTMAEV